MSFTRTDRNGPKCSLAALYRIRGDYQKENIAGREGVGGSSHHRRHHRWRRRAGHVTMAGQAGLPDRMACRRRQSLWPLRGSWPWSRQSPWTLACWSVAGTTTQRGVGVTPPWRRVGIEPLSRNYPPSPIPFKRPAPRSSIRFGARSGRGGWRRRNCCPDEGVAALLVPSQDNIDGGVLREETLVHVPSDH